LFWGGRLLFPERKKSVKGDLFLWSSLLIGCQVGKGDFERKKRLFLQRVTASGERKDYLFYLRKRGKRIEKRPFEIIFLHPNFIGTGWL